MSEIKTALQHLVGADIRVFKITQMIEVYRMDEEGRSRTGTVGFFKNSDIAEAFAKVEGGHTYRTAPALVLTNGVDAFVIRDQEPVKLFDDGVEALRLREKVLQKLSPEERKILGL